MSIPFLSGYVKRRKIYRLRRIMRGYRSLKISCNLGLIRRVKRQFADTPIKSVGEHASVFFFGAGKDSAELITRQYLLFRNTGISLHKSLLYTLGSGNKKVICSIPAEYRKVLEENGFKVSHFRSSILWTYNVFVLWCFGVYSILGHWWQGVRRLLNTDSAPPNKYVYFIGLQKNNLPQPCRDGRSHDIITWYTQWQGSSKNITEFRHSVKGSEISHIQERAVVYKPEYIPPVDNIKNLVSFTTWSVGAIIVSFLDIFLGKWWNAFLLSEMALARITRFSKPEQLAADYLFANSDSVYRPLWTYEAEQKKSRIISYFYSTFEDFKLPSGYQPNSTYWQAMNWPLYLVWDDFQAQQVKRNAGEESNVEITGPIWLSTSSKELPDLPADSVAVFDIQPVKSTAHFGFSTIGELDYGNPKVAIDFVSDIEEVLSKKDAVIIHKRKRKGDKHVHKGYLYMLNGLEEAKRLIQVEPDTSPIRVMEKCKAVLSMPFTSTAILARYLGKPSAYYDPTGLLQKDDRGAHNIPLLSNKKELEEWIEKVFKD